MSATLKKRKEQIDSKDSKLFLSGRENLRLKLKLRSLILKLIEYSGRGSMKSICLLLNKAADERKLDDNAVFEDLLESIARSFHKKKQGNDISQL